jgi:hypothetical protein
MRDFVRNSFTANRMVVAAVGVEHDLFVDTVQAVRTTTASIISRARSVVNVCCVCAVCVLCAVVWCGVWCCVLRVVLCD